MIFLVLFTSFAAIAAASPCENIITIRGTWDWGQDGIFNLTIPNSISSWTMSVSFDKPVTTLNSWDGSNTTCSTNGNGTTCTFNNQVKLKAYSDKAIFPCIYFAELHF